MTLNERSLAAGLFSALEETPDGARLRKDGAEILRRLADEVLATPSLDAKAELVLAWLDSTCWMVERFADPSLREALIAAIEPALRVLREGLANKVGDRAASMRAKLDRAAKQLRGPETATPLVSDGPRVAANPLARFLLRDT